MCLVTWPLSRSKARTDFVWVQTSVLFKCKSWFMSLNAKCSDSPALIIIRVDRLPTFALPFRTEGFQCNSCRLSTFWQLEKKSIPFKVDRVCEVQKCLLNKPPVVTTFTGLSHRATVVHCITPPFRQTFHTNQTSEGDVRCLSRGTKREDLGSELAPTPSP